MFHEQSMIFIEKIVDFSWKYRVDIIGESKILLTVIRDSNSEYLNLFEYLKPFENLNPPAWTSQPCQCQIFSNPFEHLTPFENFNPPAWTSQPC